MVEEAKAEEEAKHFYPVGQPGVAWGEAERAEWLELAGQPKRSYKDDVLRPVEALAGRFELHRYGELAIDPARYPLVCVKSRGWEPTKPSLLITGGTHGYETSGVRGAIRFLQTEAERYSGVFNVAVVPCVCPWGYECIQRWNPQALDPNRCYVPESAAEECAALLGLVASLGVEQWTVHLDLHETTDTDFTEFRPAKASRDGLPLADEVIPDGFYLMGCLSKPQPEWHRAMIDAVRQVTHIAPADEHGMIMGLPLAQPGVINSDPVGKGKGATNALFATTTEVYPDSKERPVSAEDCDRAQVAVIVGGLDYIIANAL